MGENRIWYGVIGGAVLAGVLTRVLLREVSLFQRMQARMSRWGLGVAQLTFFAYVIVMPVYLLIAPYALLLALAACGGASKPARGAAPAATPAEAPAEPAAEAPPVPTTCDDACTDYAICWEDVNGGDYSGGGECVSACEEMSDEERAAYFQCVSSSDCAAVEAC